MAPSTIRKAIGAVKDQTSISLAKVAGNVAPDLEVLIVKATSHDNEPTDEKYVREILNMVSSSRGYVSPCVFAVSKRLSKTRDWIVALKGLMLVHRLLNDGDPAFGQEIMRASRQGMRVLNMSHFRDETHSNAWDNSGFVRSYALYLDQKLEFMAYERKLRISADEKKRHEDSHDSDKRTGFYGDVNETQTERYGVSYDKEMGPEKVLERLNQLLRLVECFLASRPTGAAKNTRMVLIALSMLVKESFRLYFDVSDFLIILFDRFMELEYASCVKAFDAYVNAAKTFDELVGIYGWCKDIGVLRSSEFPLVQKISVEVLGTLEGLMREKGNRTKNTTKKNREDQIPSEISGKEEKLKAQDSNEIKSLPAPPEKVTGMTPSKQKNQQQVAKEEELVNLKDDGVSADDSKMQLVVFSNNAWEEFPEDDTTSAWQNPAAEHGRADWESALVETSSRLSKQKADFAGGFDPLLLNGMYDQGTVRQHVNNSQLSGGSASSVVPLPLTHDKSKSPVLALPAPDGTVKPVGTEDPFAASLWVPPPPWVQIADMEKKQQLLAQEQRVWDQYASGGMQGQLGLSKIDPSIGMLPYGMPQVDVVGQHGFGGYHYTSF